jgi:predicted Rossmann-fold nucleotide-binding protein
LIEAGTISKKDMDLFQVTDDPQFVVDTIFDFYEGVELDQIVDDSQLMMDL